MLIVFGILLLTVVVLMIDLPDLWKRKNKRELSVYSVLLVLAIGVSVAKALRVQLPNPQDWLAYLYKPFSDFLFGLFK